MCAKKRVESTGENLVRQELITRDELLKAKKAEATSGTPWYKQLIQSRKVSFGAVEDMLRFEFHSKATKTAQATMGDTLLGMGAITQAQLDEVVKLQKKKGAAPRPAPAGNRLRNTRGHSAGLQQAARSAVCGLE